MYKALLAGPLLGVLVFVAVMFTGLAQFLYYPSGAWLVDKLLPALGLYGEKYIPIGFLLVLLVCMLTTTAYCALICKFLSRKQN